MKFNLVPLTLALMISVSPAAFAKDATDGKSENVAVEKLICEQLYMHKPAADVAYQPGVDVNGNPVVPADVPSQAQVMAPEYIEVPLTVALAQKLGGATPPGMEMKAVVGMLHLYSSGKIVYNGNDLTGSAATMCGKQMEVMQDTMMAPQQGAAVNSATITPEADNVPVVTADKPIAGGVAISATTNPPPKEPDAPKLSSRMANFLGQPAE